MGQANAPLLSICIPTYENADSLSRVLEQALSVQYPDVEFVVGDDASTDRTVEILNTVEDDRVRTYTNDSNLGYEENLLKIVGEAEGTYVLPLSDEDKLEIEGLELVVETVTTNPSISAIIGGYGESSWARACNTEHEVADGRRSMIEFARKYGEYKNVWSRSYIGGFVLRRSSLDLAAASRYTDSYYIHNVLIYQALADGITLYTPQDLCQRHYFTDICSNEHRIWSNIDKFDLYFNIGLHRSRVRFVLNEITDPVVREECLQIERHWAALATAWALISSEYSVSSVHSRLRSITKTEEDPCLYTTLGYWLLSAGYALVYFVPFQLMSMDKRWILTKSPAVNWWDAVFKHLLPERVTTEVKSGFYAVKQTLSRLQD